MKFIRKKPDFKFFKILLIIFFVIFMISTLNPYEVKCNLSPSVQIGIYLTKKYKYTKTLKKGQYITFSIDDIIEDKPTFYEQKNVDGNADYLKKIVATDDDIILIQDKKIYINGEYKGRILEKDGFGKRLPGLKNGKYILKEKTYFVMGENPFSYDSRYYGAIPATKIKEVGFLLIPFSF